MTSQPSNPEILETVVDQFTAALRAGKRPSIADYQGQYPNLKNEINELLSSVAMIEELKTCSETRTDHRPAFSTVSQLKQIGDYKIVRELGRGGMGIVFEAIHNTLGRRVAIKVMPTPLVDGEQHVQRFRHESQAAARLHHTNIVSVFGVGDGDGFYFYVMDFVDGDTLGEWIADHSERDTNYRRSARLIANIADALSYAHAANILHRDIKPANIIVDHHEIVWITDFGLAKDGSREINLTKTGDLIGTPQYLAPESLEGKYDERSETYCLGLTLYELVTQQPAYAQGSPAEVLRAVATSSPTHPRNINPKIPRDLATIITKSVSREPELRYQTAAEFQQDLLAFIDDRPISAVRPRWSSQLLRWTRRNPLPASLIGISAVLLTLVAATATIGYWATTNALQRESEKTARLNQEQQATAVARDEAQQNFANMKTQYDRAESNVAITIEAFDEMFKHFITGGSGSMGELDIDGFREISGIETTITTSDVVFLEKLVSFYEQFASLNAENERLKSESAKAFRRVGNIYQLIGEMQPAIDSYHHSIVLSEAILKNEPTVKDHLLTLVETQNELSAAHRKNGDPQLAQSWNRKSQKLLEESPWSETDPVVRLELARTLTGLGFNLFRMTSVANLGTLANNKLPLRSQKPGVKLNGLIEGQRVFERRQRQLIEQAIGIMDELVADSPGEADYRCVRATCYSISAAAHLEADRQKGFPLRDHAIQEFESLVESHPANPEYRYLLALTCSLGGSELHPDDVELIEQSVAITQKLIEQFPTLLDYHHLYASLKVKQASYHISQQHREMGLQDLRSARNSIDQLIDRTPSDRSFLRTMLALVNELQQLAKYYDREHQREKSSKIYQLIREIRNRMRTQGNNRERVLLSLARGGATDPQESNRPTGPPRER
jgi:serine/threonine protein kinase